MHLSLPMFFFLDSLSLFFMCFLLSFLHVRNNTMITLIVIATTLGGVGNVPPCPYSHSLTFFLFFSFFPIFYKLGIM